MAWKFCVDRRNIRRLKRINEYKERITVLNNM